MKFAFVSYDVQNHEFDSTPLKTQTQLNTEKIYIFFFVKKEKGWAYEMLRATEVGINSPVYVTMWELHNNIKQVEWSDSDTSPIYI